MIALVSSHEPPNVYGVWKQNITTKKVLYTKEESKVFFSVIVDSMNVNYKTRFAHPHPWQPDELKMIVFRTRLIRA